MMDIRGEGTERITGERLGGSLGFNIVGGDGADGIYVSYVHPKRPAARSKSVSVGDRLLVVRLIPCEAEKISFLVKLDI